MLTVPGKVYYYDQVVPNDGKTDIAALERSLTNLSYYLRGWEIKMDPGAHIQLALEILTYDASDTHTPAIINILTQHNLHVKDMRYSVVSNNMYYNIVAYVVSEIAIPDRPNTRVVAIDPYQDEIDNPLI